MGLVTTSTAVAHPWLCDVMGHMNTRHIMAVFDDAGFILLARLGFAVDRDVTCGQGWADVRLEMDLSREVPVGTVLRVCSGVERVGNKSFTHVHALMSGADDILHARLEVTTVRFDLHARRAIALPEDFADRALPYIMPAGTESGRVR